MIVIENNENSKVNLATEPNEVRSSKAELFDAVKTQDSKEFEADWTQKLIKEFPDDSPNGKVSRDALIEQCKANLDKAK